MPPSLLKQTFKQVGAWRCIDRVVRVVAQNCTLMPPLLQILLAMDFCHRSHMIHGDMKLAQVLLRRPVVLQPSSSSADHRKLPVVHVKVAGDCCCRPSPLMHHPSHITRHTSPVIHHPLLVSQPADFGDSRFSLRQSMDTSSAGTSGFASHSRAHFNNIKCSLSAGIVRPSCS